MQINNKIPGYVYGKLFLLLFICSFLSCKKNDSNLNREINAIIVHSSGNTVTINAKESDALLGKSAIPVAIYGEGNQNNYRIAWSIPPVTAPGTYTDQYLCSYFVAVATGGPVYDNRVGWVKNPGSITFTTVTSDYIEGTFTATCKISMTATDSVMVTGSFKGDLR